MTRREIAMENFKKGYNCSQAIVLAFADLLPMDRTTLLRIASSFGGGITASDMGVKLYTAYGFKHNGNFMMYNL